MLTRLNGFTVYLSIFAILALSGCAHMTRETLPPRVELVGLQLQQVQLFEQRYLLKIRMENRNDFELNIEGFDFNVEINNSPFAHGVSNKEVSMAGFGEAVTDIAVTSNIMTLMQQINKAKDSVKYRVSGRVKIEGIPISMPFETEGEMNLRANGS